MTSVRSILHGRSNIRLLPLIIIVVMHGLLFMVLSHSNVLYKDGDMSGLPVALLISVPVRADQAIQKTEEKKSGRDGPLPAPKKERQLSPTSTVAPAPAEKLPAPQSESKSIFDTAADTGTATSAQSAVSLAQLRSQATLLAREAAQGEASQSAHAGVFGDYYGSYNGADAGTFYIHVDGSGNIFGSADSGTAHSSFTITGKVSTDGVVQMTGKGLAGSASFDGRINMKTGAVSGHWNLTGFGRGQFTGQRARLAGSKGF